MAGETKSIGDLMHGARSMTAPLMATRGAINAINIALDNPELILTDFDGADNRIFPPVDSSECYVSFGITMFAVYGIAPLQDAEPPALRERRQQALERQRRTKPVILLSDLHAASVFSSRRASREPVYTAGQDAEQLRDFLYAACGRSPE